MAHIRTYAPDPSGFFADLETANGSCRLQYTRNGFHVVFANGYSCSIPDFSRASQALDYVLHLLA